jgi:outer membrane protein TolC
MLSTTAAPASRRGWARSCAIFIALLLANTAARAQDGALTLEAALRSAIDRSASMEAAQSSVRASSEMAVKADQLPEPTLAAGIDNLPINGQQGFTVGQNILTMRRIGIEQEWVSPEKRRLRSTLANQVVGREQSTYLAQLANVRQQTALAWLNAAYAKKALSLQQDLAGQMTHELAATQASYRGAQASAADVVQAHYMLAQMQDQLLKSQTTWQTALISLSRWTASPVSDVTGEPPAPQSVVASLPPDQLREVQPVLVAAASDIGVADADTAVANSNRRSNWTWNVSYLQGGGASRFVSVGVSIPLPINRKNVEDRDTAEKAELGTRARLMYEDTQRQVEAEIHSLAATLANGRARIANLNQSMLPAADQRVRLASAAYRSGAGALAETFAARRAQLDAQLQILNLQRDVSLVWAQLDYQVVPPAMAAASQ